MNWKMPALWDPFEGSKAREVLMTPEDLEDMATDNDDEFESEISDKKNEKI